MNDREVAKQSYLWFMAESYDYVSPATLMAEAEGLADTEGSCMYVLPLGVNGWPIANVYNALIGGLAILPSCRLASAAVVETLDTYLRTLLHVDGSDWHGALKKLRLDQWLADELATAELVLRNLLALAGQCDPEVIRIVARDAEYTAAQRVTTLLAVTARLVVQQAKR